MCRLLARGSAPALVLVVEVNLLCRKKAVLSFWTMTDCTVVVVVALEMIVAEMVHMGVGYN